MSLIMATNVSELSASHAVRAAARKFDRERLFRYEPNIALDVLEGFDCRWDKTVDLLARHRMLDEALAANSHLSNHGFKHGQSHHSTAGFVLRAALITPEAPLGGHRRGN